MFGLELVSGVVDGDADFEVRDVVPLHSHRRDLRDLPLERPILEGLDAYARGLAKPQVPDFGLVHPPANEDLRDVSHRNHRRGGGAHVEDR